MFRFISIIPVTPPPNEPLRKSLWEPGATSWYSMAALIRRSADAAPAKTWWNQCGERPAPGTQFMSPNEPGSGGRVPGRDNRSDPVAPGHGGRGGGGHQGVQAAAPCVTLCVTISCGGVGAARSPHPSRVWPRTPRLVLASLSLSLSLSLTHLSLGPRIYSSLSLSLSLSLSGNNAGHLLCVRTWWGMVLDMYRLTKVCKMSTGPRSRQQVWPCGHGGRVAGWGWAPGCPVSHWPGVSLMNAFLTAGSKAGMTESKRATDTLSTVRLNWNFLRAVFWLCSQ